ncbi:hypothetical protein [Nostoc sp. NMS4]|uniref:hypothetical protein n=1 Tax=Nostoc sp. NMS4 TaxID=2815390 RepID=UPI0025F3BB4C|nr:hypothetical protein [Nostoc sp. NMS4]MBN3924904.1 hypothetical protein [Nostoc sp. NMS4]
MRILLDECVPRPLRRELSDYEVRTVVEMGWSGKKNGELLQLMIQGSFTILLTTDQNLRYQQNLQQAGVAVVVLVASSNRLPDLLPLIPSVRSVLATIAPGVVVEIGDFLSELHHTTTLFFLMIKPNS